jgi:hypothetical protein
MQQTAPPPSPSPSFAGLLAAHASPAPAWSDDDLADDVATLSYERSLRTHLRDRHAGLPGRSLPQSAESEPIDGGQEPGADDSLLEPRATALRSQYLGADSQPKTAIVPMAPLEKDLKCASVTLRLSKAENAQLRQRAAEAGLTISDYLRSCTFETESLRALVKNTLAQLRTNSSRPDGANARKNAPNPARRAWFGWFWALLPFDSCRRRVARA